jgi:archaellum component FlaG (FlaF/FlaG flagellin family)
MESAMIREQAINFLQALVVFLLLTNAISALVTVYAMRLANAVNPKADQATSALERRIEAFVARHA